MRPPIAVLIAALGLPVVLFAPVAARSQQGGRATQGPTLKVSTEVVNVYAVVRDKKGRLIPNLNKEDFELEEDNARQEIRYFAREADTPLTLGLLIDTSPSQERVLGVEKQEAKAFIRQVLRPKDMAFVIHFDLEVELLQEFTSDARFLARAIDETVINGGGQGVLPGPIPTAPVGGTHLYDAVYLAANDLMKNEVGRKVLILLTDGEDQGSKLKLNVALEAAQKADIIVYSVAVIDRGFYFGHGVGFSGDSVLKKLSEETGGHVVRVERRGDTAAAFEEIAQELRTQYSLGYTPSNSKRNGTFRKIRLRVAQGDYKIQARRGYYAPSEQEAAEVR